MSTGYTDKIKDDITFEQTVKEAFALLDKIENALDVKEQQLNQSGMFGKEQKKMLSETVEHSICGGTKSIGTNTIEVSSLYGQDDGRFTENLFKENA